MSENNHYISSNPINSILRFLLEMTALFSYGYWGWSLLDCILRYFLAFFLVIIPAVIWGVFSVPGDSSRSGRTLIPVPGNFRLSLEFILFSLAVIAFFAVGHILYATIFGAIVIIHYVISHDRISWMLKH